MVALTYSDARAARVDTAAKAATAETVAPRKSFFHRLLDAMMEARMHQAQREIRLYARRWPLDGKSNSQLGGW